MAVRRVQLRRGTHAQNDAFTGAVGEITVDTDNNSIRVHDGATAGGSETLRADMSNLGTNVLSVNGTVSFADSAGNSTVRLTNVANPTGAQDVATKAYVDSGGAANILFEDLGDTDINDTNPLADAQMLFYDAGTSKWWNRALSGDASVTDLGVLTLSNDAITLAKIDIISDDAITNAKLANESFSVTDGATTDTVALGTTLTFSNVANETTIAVTADAGAGAEVTVGLPDSVTIADTLTVSNNVAITNDITSVRDITTTQDVSVGRDLSVGRNVTVTGNLTVSGTTTTIDSTTVSTADRVIELNKDIGASSNVNDLGLFLKRGGGDPDALFIWDEGEDSANGAFVLATHSDANVDGTTSDYSGVAGMSYAPLFMGALTAESALVEGNVVLKSDNASLDIQKADSTSVFSVDSDNGNTIIAGTASITGTLGVTGVTTLDDTLAIPTGATTSSILINSDRAGDTSVDANIFAVERGTDGADATLTWDESETAFLLSNIFHSVGGLSIGGADPSAQTASLSSAGALSLDSSLDVGTSATVGTTLAVTSTTSLGGTTTLDTDAFLLVKAGSNESSNLIVLNNDVDGQGGNPVAQDAHLAVRRGAASYATMSWVEDNTAWTFSNSGSFATDLSVGNDLTVTATASVNLLEVKGDGQSAIILNSDLGNVAPTADAGITVERGSSADAKIYFDEVTDNTWKIDRGDGNGASEVVLASDTIPLSALAQTTISFTDGANTDPVELGETLTLNNVANETEITVGANQITIGLPDAVTLGTSLTVGTLTISDGLIDDTDGSISLGNSNLTAVGTIASGTVTVGTTSFASGSITDTNGTVSFGDDNLKTIGNLQIRNALDTQDALLISANGDDATITSFGGDISFDNENLTTTGKITTGTLESTGQADFGASVVLSADNALLDVQKADTTSVFSVDSDNGNTLVGGTLGVTGLSTFTDNVIPSVNGGGSVGVNGTRWGAVFSDALTVTNNSTIGGTLGVTGIATFTSEAQLDGGIDVNGSNFTVSSANGNVLTEGTLRVKGATTLDGNVLIYDDTTDPTFTIQKTLDASTVFSVDASNGNTVVAGTLNVTGTPTFTSEAQLDGGLDVNGSLFTVASATGNVVTQGDLRVQGTTTLDGDVAIYDAVTAPDLTVRDTTNTAVFTVVGASGNTTVEGTLDVTGVVTATANIIPSADGGADLGLNGTRWGTVYTDALTITNNATVGGTLGVTSTSTFTGQATFNGGVVGENGFEIADGTGAITTNSTLSVGGQTTIEAGLSSINGQGGAETFGVLANGNTTVSGTLAVAKTVTVDSADGSADLLINNNTAQRFLVEGDTGNTDIEGTLNVAGNTEIETGNLTITTGDVTVTAGDLALTAGGITATASASSFQSVSASSLSQSGGTLTLVSGGGAATDAFLKIERGATDADIKWNETDDKWQINSGTGNFYTLLDSNTTLFTLSANGSTKNFSLQGTDSAETLTLAAEGGVNVTHGGNGTVTFSLTDSVSITSNLTVGGTATFNSTTMRLSDPLLFMGLNNTSALNHVGFYGQYDDGALNSLYAGLIYQPSNSTFKLFGSETGLGSTEVSINPTDSELSDLDLANLNVKGGGLTITKTTGETVDEDPGVDNAIVSNNDRAFQITVTLHNTLVDGARSSTFTVNSTSVSSTSVILATCKSANVDVHPHTIVDATSFKFDFTNRTGAQLNQDDTVEINFVMI